jgi:hypothetical protein
MKDKKKIATAITGIVSTLQKGYDLLNEGGQLQTVSKEDLPALAPHIVKALNIQLTEIEDHAQYEGMTYEEMLEKKEADRQEAIKRNLEAAGEALRKLKGTDEPEPAETERNPETQTEEK